MKLRPPGLAISTEAYVDLFPRTVRDRGWDYFEKGAVRLTAVGSERVEAVVFGSQLYRVELDPRAEDLAADCTCAYFRDSGFCKHLWATILAAELETQLAGETPAGEDFTRNEVIVPGRRPNPPGWRDQLGAIRLASTRTLGETWPPEREIGYSIDVNGTLAGRGLVVEVAQRRKKANGEWTRLKVQKVSADQIAGLPDPSDRLRAELPEELRVEEVPGEPRPRLRVAPTGRYGRLLCQASFDYDGATISISQGEPGWAVFQREPRRVLLRNHIAEEAAYRTLREVGARPTRRDNPEAPEQLELAPARLPGAVRKLLAEGWQVEAEGRVLRPAGAFRVQVRTGLD